MRLGLFPVELSFYHIQAHLRTALCLVSLTFTANDAHIMEFNGKHKHNTYYIVNISLLLEREHIYSTSNLASIKQIQAFYFNCTDQHHPHYLIDHLDFPLLPRFGYYINLPEKQRRTNSAGCLSGFHFGREQHQHNPPRNAHLTAILEGLWRRNQLLPSTISLDPEVAHASHDSEPSPSRTPPALRRAFRD
ncbi:hypothetical protein K493DRAFT_359057 [Basidiobolus meristosporus CBS 931.73]|uniref:Uncharacterized protein n=1 Tax=Basidiobolus meristosporus CBS 931.73 TaxID=1314790 RepID=A0A1Y1XSN9_9FUNG|nr:hypothetical protein K493DRAFT_359057 [Basidiobolus meristosporus CBS 931.73]|eukprot:ORX88777.1 hypothetical protein K493DRAFT_359057 [Basidiobolus meristosporus CBS 931.73]